MAKGFLRSNVQNRHPFFIYQSIPTLTGRAIATSQAIATSVSFLCRKQHVVGGLVTACGEMLVSDVPQQKRNLDCTFERCVRKATERKTTVVFI